MKHAVAGFCGIALFGAAALLATGSAAAQGSQEELVSPDDADARANATNLKLLKALEERRAEVVRSGKNAPYALEFFDRQIEKIKKEIAQDRLR